jgi:fructoselysine 6-kinase
MRVIGVGDNTVDRYLHLGQMFPGGNAVNVSVLANRYGYPSSYLGWLADDPHGRLIMEALAAEGVDCSHCRVVPGKNAYCEITLKDGDRVFGEYDEGVCDQINLSERDFEFISAHDLIHTSIYSFVEPFLEQLAEVSNMLSFDFSQEWNPAYLEQVLPHIDIAILSNPDASPAENENLLHWIATKGPRLVLITAGEGGALLSDGHQVYQQNIEDVEEVVDTLGAGDAFAARFMVEYLDGIPVPEALARAAQSAAETCQYYGAFGHGAALYKFQPAKSTTGPLGSIE